MLAPTTAADDELFALLELDRLVGVVDIGSNPIDGNPPYAGLLANRLCSVVGFEPQSEALDKLNECAGPLERYSPYVVGDGTPGTLHICRAAGLTSLLRPDPTRLALLNLHTMFGEVSHTLTVNTARLDDIDVGPVDFLKIDVQGGELGVFNGALEKLKDTTVIQTEVSFFPIYEGQPTFADVDTFLRGQGFIMHCFAELKRWPISPAVVDGNPRKALRQAVEADVVYVRDWTRDMAPAQWKMLAFIAHHVYQSYDLALKAIERLTECEGGLAGDAPRRYAALLRGMQ